MTNELKNSLLVVAAASVHGIFVARDVLHATVLLADVAAAFPTAIGILLARADKLRPAIVSIFTAAVVHGVVTVTWV